jgi:hypothetical protein
MATSEARILANQTNAQNSTGPKTPEGKGHSRRNGLKHGLAGAGIVLADEDAGAVERRDAELQAELDPQSALGKILVRQMAKLSVRMERSGQQESAAIEFRARHAVENFDRARVDEADRLIEHPGDDTRKTLRTLRSSPEGVERMILAWRELRDDLVLKPRPNWTVPHMERADRLTGFRLDIAGEPRINALSKAVRGDFSDLAAGDGADLDRVARIEWARSRLLARIDGEIAELEAHHESLDFETIDLDRAQAPARTLFDPSREASLARRYESEATRGFYKALKELREVEAEEAALQIAADTPAPEEEVQAPLASSRESSGPADREPRPTPGPSRPGDDEPDRGPVGRLEARGRVAVGST